MGFFSAVKNGVKSGFKVNRWLGIEHIKDNAKVIGNLSKQLLQNQKSSDLEGTTFEEYLSRHNITEEGIKNFKRNASLMGWLYLLGGGFALVYAVILAFHHHITGTFFTFMLAILLFAYSFREYFNLYRVNQRRLDCTVKQWVQQHFSSRSK